MLLLVLFVCLLPSLATQTTQTTQSWFLTDQEIASTRGGYPRDNISLSSNDNDVVPLIDGKNFMSDLYQTIVKTQKGDFIHASFFDENADVLLVPNSLDLNVSETTKISNVLAAAAQRGVTLRILANQNYYLPTNALKFCRPLNKACGYTCCSPDYRHHGRTGSEHTKLWVIQSMGETVAYVGSMDITQGRWDTRYHNNSKDRSLEPGEMTAFYGWHGMMYKMHGSVVLDVFSHFAHRWNDPPAPFLGYKLTPFKWFKPPIKSYGKLACQMLLTYSCKGATEDGYYKGFAPQGEYTFAAAFTKMVNNTKNFLYLSDQFMFYPEAMKIVADNLHHIDRVVIMTVEAAAFDVNVAFFNVTVASSMRYYYQRKAWAPFNMSNKISFFQLVKPGAPYNTTDGTNFVYNHAKIYLSDDKFALVGSHGIERTGWTNDVELSVAVEDTTWVANLRKSLWAEHLGIPVESEVLKDPLKAIQYMDTQAVTNEKALGKLRSYYPQPRDASVLYDALYNFYEPEGRCGK